MESQIIFSGTQSTAEHRKMLAEAGFVHVTGLRTFNTSLADDSYIIGEALRPEKFGRWGSNNGLTVVITPGAEVWLKAGHIDENSKVGAELATGGVGAFVPLSNGEQVSWYDLLRRVADPSYNIFVPA